VTDRSLMHYTQMMKSFILCLLAAALALIGSGCASPNVDPPKARAGLGYVDFYCADADGLYWDITDAKTRKKVFYDFNPFDESILRLALKPGHYELSINVMNHAITTQGTVDVDVSDGMITPVTVTLAPAGTETVQTTSTFVGGTYYGRYGRNTHIVTTATTTYDILAEARQALPYAPKAQMLYFKRPDQ
jgi:hypothetical protein